MKPKQKVTRGRGRPEKITLAVVRQVGEWMGKGMTEAQACCAVGVNAETFGPAVSRRPELRAAMEKEKVKMLGHALNWLLGIQDGDCPIGPDIEWTRVAFLLERRFKKDGQFSRLDLHNVGDAKGEPVMTMTEDLQKWMQAKAAEMYVREKHGGKA